MRPADRAWITIGVGVTVYELAASVRPDWELLSEAMDRYRSRHRGLVAVTVTYLAGHLLRIWPPQGDPLTVLTRAARTGWRRR